MTQLFRIKICGITQPADAVSAARAGADAIGLNFYRRSVRFVDDDRAASIAAACPDGVKKVGVFVDEPIDEILRRAELLRLDWIQLHGDEPPETIGRLGKLPVIRAFRCRDHRLEPVAAYLDRCRSSGATPDAVLLDAWTADQHGGTGERLDWHRLQREIVRLADVPWVLAGGLRADNVESAIRLLQPQAVDTASGVESSPGVKDEQQLIRFVRAAQAASNPY